MKDSSLDFIIYFKNSYKNAKPRQQTAEKVI